jgi:hypothetical protein
VKITFAAFAKARDFTCLGSWCVLFGVEQHLKRRALAIIREEVAAAAGSEAEASWEALDGANLLRATWCCAPRPPGFQHARGSSSGRRKINRSSRRSWRRDLGKRPSRASPPQAITPAVGRSSKPVAAADGDRGARHRKPKDRRDAVCARASTPSRRRRLIARRWGREACSTNHAKALGKRLDVAAAQMLISRVGTSLGELHRDRSCGPVGDRPAITCRRGRGDAAH